MFSFILTTINIISILAPLKKYDKIWIYKKKIMKSEYYNLEQEIESFYSTLKDNVDNIEIDCDAGVEEKPDLLNQIQNIIENVIDTVNSDIENIQDSIDSQLNEDSLFMYFIEDKNEFLELEKKLLTINSLLSNMYDIYNEDVFSDLYKSHSKEQESMTAYEKEIEEEKESLEQELAKDICEEELEEHENIISTIEEKIKQLESYKNESESNCEEYKESYNNETINISKELEKTFENIINIVSDIQPFIEQLIELKNAIYPEKIENDKNYTLTNILEFINNQEKQELKKQIKRKI